MISAGSQSLQNFGKKEAISHNNNWAIAMSLWTPPTANIAIALNLAQVLGPSTFSG